jgi:hypothetical protein
MIVYVVVLLTIKILTKQGLISLFLLLSIKNHELSALLTDGMILPMNGKKLT